jgi:tetratricopeptide (TPR) repeat protein
VEQALGLRPGLGAGIEQQLAPASVAFPGRRELHRRTAKMLSEHFATLPAARPELLAHHWAEGGEPQLAIKAWHQAGDDARARRAFREAQQAYQAALSLLLTLPASAGRDALELPLHCSLAEVLRFTRGYSAQETIAATTRARTLAEKNGDITQQFSQAVGMWAAASSSGDYLTARHLADQVLELALADRRELSLAHAHMIQMTSWYRIGNLLRAEDYFERGEDLFRSPEFRKQPGWTAQTYGNAAINAWTMGDQVRAQQRIDLALSIAQENDNPYDLAFAESMAALHAVLTDSLSLANAISSNHLQVG